MPHEMIVGKIEFSPATLDTYSAGRQLEMDRLKAANRLLREAIKTNAIKQGVTDMLEPWAARVLELTHNV